MTDDQTAYLQAITSTARRGTYRVVYRTDDHIRTVTVLDVAHRRDAYRTGR